MTLDLISWGCISSSTWITRFVHRSAGLCSGTHFHVCLGFGLGVCLLADLQVLYVHVQDLPPGLDSFNDKWMARQAAQPPAFDFDKITELIKQAKTVAHE